MRADNPARASIEMIVQTGDRARELTRQLLAVSRRQILVPQVLDLNAVVSNMYKMLERLIGTNITLTMRLAGDLNLVTIDPSQLGQVILNLAVNARDAMPDGGALTIETFNLNVTEEVASVDAGILPGPYAVITVRDTGCGMDETVRRQVFEPFFTTKGVGKGTGLGLATVHGIVRQSGGHITVSSQVGHGTVFHVYLPTVQETVPVDTQTSRQTDKDREAGVSLPVSLSCLLASS